MLVLSSTNSSQRSNLPIVQGQKSLTKSEEAKKEGALKRGVLGPFELLNIFDLRGTNKVCKNDELFRRLHIFTN
jgi:hypothetical protein